MRQQSLAASGFERFRKKTRNELFWRKMDQIIPWPRLTTAIELFYPKADGAGRRPFGINRMLPIYFCRIGFNYPIPAQKTH